MVLAVNHDGGDSSAVVVVVAVTVEARGEFRSDDAAVWLSSEKANR